MNAEEVYQWMLEQRERFCDPQTGEVNATQLAEAAAIEYELPKDSETVYELAFWAAEA